jgi:4-amino-4-deoxy-L-arabinose transferase-like glycosyltransferase
MSTAPGTVPARGRTAALLLLLTLALVFRVYLAATRPYVHDEINTSIPLSETISFDPDRPNLPLRGPNHGAMPAYVVKAGSTLFGSSAFGNRSAHVLLGLLTMALVYGLAKQWGGPVAGLWAMGLLAFNEYYLDVSSRATAHVPYLFFVGLALAAFVRFLGQQRPAYLFVAAVSTGLAFYCKEHAALLLPVFFLGLLHPRYRGWLARPHAYLAAAVFALVIAPDVAWNLRTEPDSVRIALGAAAPEQTTYSQHLRRIGGVGLSPYPAMFYARGAVQRVHVAVTGSPLVDETPEYQSMNAALGAVLLAVLAMAAAGWRRREWPETFLALHFWSVFGFFTLVDKGNPPGRLDPVSWIWVESTILPAVVLTGVWLSRATGRARVVAWALCFGLLAYAATPTALAIAGRSGSEVRNGRDVVRHFLQVTAITTVERVRSRPLRAVAIAGAAGVAVGALAGFWMGRHSRSRRRGSGGLTR